MSTTTESPRTRGPWQWSRTEETQRNLLDAALELFIENGYAGTSIADIVERAGSSVGSLYHHFGDKNGVYLALWDDWMNAQEALVKSEVERARAAGISSAIDLYDVAARAFLQAGWRAREAGRFFVNQDVPAGFEATRRERRDGWIGYVSILLVSANDATGRLTVAVLTMIIAEAQREVMVCERWRDAEHICDAAIAMVRKLGLGIADTADTADIANTIAVAGALQG